MSDSNRIRVSIVPQVSFAAGTPTDPAWQVLATTGQSIRDRIGYQQSQTINNDRNVQDLIRLSKSAGGGIPMELTWSPSAVTASSPAGEGLMQLITAAMAGSEDAEQSSIFGAPETVESSKTLSGSNYAANVEVGDIVRVSDSTTAADNGYYRVTVVTDTLITVAADADFASSETVTVTRAARIKNGTSEQFFSIEVARLDLDIAQVFTGCAIDGMDFNIADEAITSANFSIAGADSTFVSTPVSGGGETGNVAVFVTGAEYTDPTTSPVLDSIGVPEIRSEGAAYAAKSIQMSLLNNVSPRTQIGGLGAQSMRFGEFGASGRITAYMEDFSEMTQYANNTSTDIWLVMIDENDKGFSMSLPQVKFGDVGADVTGSNTDVLVDIAATAIKDPTELCTVRLQRWD